jgi:hypothetical protein
MAFRHLKHPFIEFKKVVFFGVQKADYEFTGPFTYLKYHLSEFIQVALIVVQVAENEFV